MNFAICDDKQQHIDCVATALKKYLSKIKEHNFIITEFNNQFDLLDKLDSGVAFDVVFLDAIMPPMNGTEVAKEIREKNYPCEIVFVTSSLDHAIDAFNVGAVHYILKPIAEQRFDEAMDRLYKKMSISAVKNVLLKTSSGGTQRLETAFVEYIESFKHTQTVNLVNQKTIEVKSSLSLIFDELTEKCGGQFIMPYKGYIVNQDLIRSIESTQIVMQSGAKIPLAKGSFRDVKDAYIEHMISRARQ